MALFKGKALARISKENRETPVEQNIQASAVVIDEARKRTEESIAEVVAAEQEGALLTEELEQLAEAEIAQEAFRQAIASTLSQGGLNPQAALMLNVGMENFQRVFGFAPSIPAMESFGSQSDRLDLTKLSMEAADGVLAKIWEAIKNAFKKVKDWVMGLFDKKKKSAEDLKARFKALKEKEVKGSLPSDAGWPLKTSAKTFRTDKVLEKSSEAVSMTENVIKFGASVGEIPKALQAKADAIKASVEAVNASKKDAAALKKAIAEADKKLNDTLVSSSVVSDVSDAPEGIKEEGASYKATNYFFGGKRLFYVTKGEDFVGVKVDTPKEAEGISDEKKMEFANANTIKSLAEKCETFFDKRDFEKESQELDKALKVIVDLDLEAEAADMKESVDAIKKAATTAQKTVTEIFGKVDADLLSGFAGVADYLEESAKAHKEA